MTSARHAAVWVEKDRNATDWQRPMRTSDWAFFAFFAAASFISFFMIPALVGEPDYAAGAGEVSNHALGTLIMQVVISGGLALTSFWYILLRKSPKTAMAILAFVAVAYAAHVAKDRRDGYR
jgi:hypothetical protein